MNPAAVTMAPMTSRNQRPAMRAARMTLVGLALAALVGACGLESQDGAIGPAPVIESASATPDEIVRPGVVSADPNWQELQLGPHVSAWLPTTGGWQLTGQGTNARGGSFVTIVHPGTGVSVRAETWPSGDQSAAALCATTLAGLLADAGVTDVTPQPSGNPAAGSLQLDAFSCQATEVPGPSGPRDQLLDVLVRETDQVTYTQLVTVPSDPADPDAVAAVLELTRQMLARTLGPLDQR